MSVMVDSSVWIDSSKPNGQSRRKLSSIINGQDIVCYTNPIQTEVCQGARTRREFDQLWDLSTASLKFSVFQAD